jgi:hypothetical protein
MTASENKMYAEAAEATGVDAKPLALLAAVYGAREGEGNHTISCLLQWIAACALLGGNVLLKLSEFMSYFISSTMMRAQEQLDAMRTPKIPEEAKKYMN